MELKDFISLLSVIAGFTASIIFITGFKSLTSTFIADWATKWQDINEHIIQTMTGQKTDYIIGATVLCSSFLLIFLTFILPEKILCFRLFDKISCTIIAGIFFLLLVWLFLVLRPRIKKKYVDDVEKVINSDLHKKL